MTVTLKWWDVRREHGEEVLRLGPFVLSTMKQNPEALWVYYVADDDEGSEPHESRDDCRQDAESHVRALLRKAGAQ